MNQQTKLVKSLKVHHLVFFGLAWMTPMIYFTVFGVAYEAADGMMVAAYLVAFLAIFFTAYSYSRMVKAYPISGSAYTYTKKSIHPLFGFFVGWALLLDYIFSPIIAILTFGIFMNTEFPSIPIYMWIIVMNVVLAIVNIVGTKSVARVSFISVMIQILFIALFCLFIVKNMVVGQTGLSHFFALGNLIHHDAPITTIFSGAAIICFCFLGFDAVTTMAEETIHPEKTIPKAIFLIVMIAAAMYIATSYFTQIAYPNFSFTNPDNAAYHLVQLVGGSLLNTIFMTVLVIATFTQGVSSVTSITRFLYALGKESILPKNGFASIHPKFNTPVFNIILVTILSFLGVFIDLNTAVTFVSFGSLTAFMFVNLSVIGHFYIKMKQRSAVQTCLYFIAPLIGAGFIGWLLTLLNKVTLGIGVSWLACGFIYLFIKTKWSKRQIDSTKDETELDLLPKEKIQ
ncbi:amino acid permease [Terrilactibacillus sp. BCM23-1]|uniref:Amino acid permease n=1 Tax=Terrilactibacillus tamarindi TaxID=2599694 RepID=A0A6N8CT33_9BACI|nr:APC family permease [Terrilactibacillus tamarindi]MTT32213.1 amino acid permease [Terrilactibacillus tamarindi]